MTTLVEVDAALNNLVDRVIAGEEITLTRGGEPVVELSPASVFNGVHFRRVRIGTRRPFSAVTAVRQMRDAD